MLEVVAAAHFQKAPAVAVGVYIEDRPLLQFARVRFDPFGRAQEDGLLAVPARVDDRALGLPALLDQSADRFGLGKHCDLTRHRIAGAEHPAVVVIAAHDPLVGPA